jgi:hypothetical protein
MIALADIDTLSGHRLRTSVSRVIVAAGLPGKTRQEGTKSAERDRAYRWRPARITGPGG